MGPEQDLKRLPSVIGQVFRFVGKTSPPLEVCWIVGTSRCCPKRGHREVADEFFVPGSEGMWFHVRFAVKVFCCASVAERCTS